MPSDNTKIPIKVMITVLLLSAVFLAISCKECPTEPDYDIYLSVEDVLCTWVTLKVTLPDSGNINNFELDRNDSTIATFTCTDDDTLITDENLTPNTDYSYRVRFLKEGKTKAESETVTVHTMPITSHDFIWEVDTLGGGVKSGSFFKDVFIISEDDVWAVGNIETDSGEYNAARWNGTKWELLGIYSNTLDLYSIYYFSENDIWVTSHCFPIHWDGENWTLYHLNNMGIDGCAGNAIWASSPDNIYFVGRKGSIVHYDGQNFEKMESGTDIDLTDIWGYDDPETGKPHVWACGNASDSRASVILYLKDGQWNKIYERYADDTNNLDDVHMYNPHCQTIWADPNSELLWIGGGFGFFTLDNKVSPIKYSEIRIIDEVGYFAYPYKVRGNSPRDLFITGAFGSLFHYNGKDWHWYSGLYNDAYRFKSIDVTPNAVFVVGSDYSSFLSKAVVVRGYR